MASRFDEQTYKIGGNNPLTTSVVTGITRSWLRRPAFEAEDIEYGIQRQWLNMPALYGVPSIPPIGVRLWIRGAYTGASTDPSVQARALEDDWSALCNLFTPYATPTGNASLVALNSARKDVSAASIGRDLMCVPTRIPTSPSALDPLGNAESNGIMCADGNYNAYYHAGFELLAPLGIWRDESATAPSIVATTGGGATQSIGGGGYLDAGIRFACTATSGSPTTVSVSGGGYSATLKRVSGNIATNDYWDFYYTTDGIALFSASATIVPGGFVLAPRTAATFTFIADAGTVTITASYKPFRAGW